MKKILKEFKTFALKGNIVDMAVGVIVGGAFGKIVTSLVNDIVMPIISIVTGKIAFENLFIALDGKDYVNIDAAKAEGVATLSYGSFITTVIDFLIIAFSIFIVVKQLNKVQAQVSKQIRDEKGESAAEPAPATTKECLYCKSVIHIDAVKCPFCISDLPAEPESKSEEEEEESKKDDKTV